MQWSEIVTITISVVVGAAFVLLTIALIWSSYTISAQYRREEKQWPQLREQGRRCQADILGMARPPSRLTVRGRNAADMAATELRLSFRDDMGAVHETFVLTFIDEGLLANFTAGHKVHVVYSDATPPVVVIDRDRTQLEIPSSSTP